MTDAEQLMLDAARLQVTWHYARLLAPLEHRLDALVRRGSVPDSGEDLAALEGDIKALRGEVGAAGVSDIELQRVLDALKRERQLLAVTVAAELRAPAAPGSYARDEHFRWGIADEPPV